jgi:hypothetical protein
VVSSAQTIAVIAIACASIAGCEQQSVPTPTATATATATATVEVINQSRSSALAQVLPKTEFSADRVSLKGISIVGSRREAWVSVDKNPPAILSPGELVLGASVIEIQPDFVVFDVAGARVRLSFSPSAASAELSPAKAASAPDLNTGSLVKALAQNGPAPMPLVEPNSTGGNSAAFGAFLEAAQRGSAK